MPRRWTATATSRSSAASSCRSACRRSPTTLILNFIQLWNEFLFAVVLITDPTSGTLPDRHPGLHGRPFPDIGMIAAGVMISVVPVIIVYIFFSEKLIRA